MKIQKYHHTDDLFGVSLSFMVRSVEFYATITNKSIYGWRYGKVYTSSSKNGYQFSPGWSINAGRLPICITNTGLITDSIPCNGTSPIFKRIL